ncbi:DsbA family protein [Leptolyngbya sp. BL0902]|uniref:DsbA family protein n=1 Tax=Leptolyngbya sp. BL0902 TaxID=1115757 RepID=UPI0018E6E244|nr:thioredoxin domain-containing protein [Leptolyngbya sp. BL0902]
MAQIWQKILHSKRLLWFCLGLVGLGLIVPLAALVPWPTLLGTAEPPSDSPAATGPKQAVVTEVITSLDRAELIATSATQGNPNAAIVLFKFSDFQCLYCAVSAAQMKDFIRRHNGDMLYVYKHFPLDNIHPEATPAAKAAWAAGQQGQFWLYHDGLFANQERLGEDLYLELASAIGLNLEQFNRDRHGPEAEATLQRDRALAQRLELQSAPTFLMNDLLIPGAITPELLEILFQDINGRIRANTQPSEPVNQPSTD